MRRERLYRAILVVDEAHYATIVFVEGCQVAFCLAKEPNAKLICMIGPGDILMNGANIPSIVNVIRLQPMSDLIHSDEMQVLDSDEPVLDDDDICA